MNTNIAGASKECVDCGCTSPKTETSYTLISAQYGWRLSRVTGEDGRRMVQWRCPECWQAHRSSRPAPPKLMSFLSGR